MIGLAGHQTGGAIELLGQHRPGQGVWPGLRSEGDFPFRPCRDSHIETVGAANGEGKVGRPLIPQIGQQGGEGARRQRLAMFVASDEVASLASPEEGFALGGLAAFLRLHFDDLDRIEAMGAANLAGATRPVFSQDGLRRRAQPADAQEGDSQCAWTWAGGSTDHIFSRL